MNPFESWDHISSTKFRKKKHGKGFFSEIQCLEVILHAPVYLEMFLEVGNVHILKKSHKILLKKIQKKTLPVSDSVLLVQRVNWISFKFYVKIR